MRRGETRDGLPSRTHIAFASGLSHSVATVALHNRGDAGLSRWCVRLLPLCQAGFRDGSHALRPPYSLQMPFLEPLVCNSIYYPRRSGATYFFYIPPSHLRTPHHPTPSLATPHRSPPETLNQSERQRTYHMSRSPRADERGRDVSPPTTSAKPVK